MNKRKAESEAKKLKCENDLSRARDFINSVEYPKRIDTEFWYYQLHNRMKFNQLMVGIFAEQHINDENWSLLKASKVLNDEQILQLESSKQLDLEMYQSIRDSNKFCGDVMDDFAYNMPSDSYLIDYLTEELRSSVTDVDFIIYPDKRNNLDDKYCPVKSVSIKDISVANALIGTSKKHGVMFDNVLETTKSLINDNNESEATSNNRESFKPDAIEDYLFSSNSITENHDLEESIDSIVNEGANDEDPQYAFIRIDTSCPPKQLDTCWKKWVEDNVSIDTKIVKDNNSLKMKKLYTKRVLQIWDLNMWCTINDIKIPKKDFKDIIFPEYKNTRSYRSYKKDYFDLCFDKVFTWDNINQLKSLIHRNKNSSQK